MRVDSWLWVVRFFKSRSLATAACRAGKVRINGTIAKASAEVAIGDKVTWRDALRPREVQVAALLPRRVGAPEAATAYIDFSPPIPTRAEQGAVPQRDRGAGRPEKRDRRDLDRLRGFQK
ncbi:MAG: RNA-binding S4 domain-containing protein [Propionibacteriaceae bacterium]|jgi:ribosome-associated heat shock protein Hsp15|nr:RNA-binding S4 domain-containing protein [Propionibacteriaceae bacterium]